MKLIVIGNCQVPGIANSLSMLLPNASVDSLFLGRTSEEQLAEASNGLHKYDIVFSHPVPDNSAYQAVRTSLLKAQVKYLRVFPAIVFTGFHPDILVIPGLLSPTGHYHSGIAVAAFLCGISARQAVKLYNALLYGALGYFDHFMSSRKWLLESATTSGYDLERSFDAWTASGVFMHSINHPKVHVLASVGRLIALREGLIADDAEDPLPQDDMLGNEGFRWPLYPEIGLRLGLPGDTLFLYPQGARQPGIELEVFVFRSYAIYENASQQQLSDRAGRHVDVLRQLIASRT